MCMTLLSNQIIQQQKQKRKKREHHPLSRVIHIILFLLANGYCCWCWNISDIFCDYNLFPVVHSTFLFIFYFTLSPFLFLFLFQFRFLFICFYWMIRCLEQQSIYYYCRFEKKRKEKKGPYEIINTKMVQNADKRLVNGKK